VVTANCCLSNLDQSVPVTLKMCIHFFGTPGIIKMKQPLNFKHRQRVVLTSNTDADWFKSYHLTSLATRLEECESYSVGATRTKEVRNSEQVNCDSAEVQNR
jgi:hypothetical protein